jgi:hypothetical protein
VFQKLQQRLNLRYESFHDKTANIPEELQGKPSALPEGYLGVAAIKG